MLMVINNRRRALLHFPGMPAAFATASVELHGKLMQIRLFSG